MAGFGLDQIACHGQQVRQSGLALMLSTRPHAGGMIENWLDGLLPDLPADRERWRASAGAVQFELVEEAIDGSAAERTAVRPQRSSPSPTPTQC